jgi:hypothetical protein
MMALLKIWKKYYTLRRFKQQEFQNGYASSGYEDTKVFLDVQPDNNSSVVTPDGRRRTAGITAYGTFPIVVDNVEDGTKGDWLFYEGWWYECRSSMMYEHSIVSHYTSSFVAVTEAIPEEGRPSPEV